MYCTQERIDSLAFSIIEAVFKSLKSFRVTEFIYMQGVDLFIARHRFIYNIGLFMQRRSFKAQIFLQLMYIYDVCLKRMPEIISSMVYSVTY